MANVFVFSIDDETAKAQLTAAEKGHELITVLNCLHDVKQAESIRRRCPDGRCYIWAVPDQGENRSTWSLMCENDLLLAHGSGSIMAAAYVQMTLESPALAISLWGEGGAPLHLMCFSDKPFTGEVPVVPQMERYLDRDFTGLARLNPGKCENILSDYGSFEVFVRLCLKYDFPFSFRHSE